MTRENMLLIKLPNKLKKAYTIRDILTTEALFFFRADYRDNFKTLEKA